MFTLCINSVNKQGTQVYLWEYSVLQSFQTLFYGVFIIRVPNPKTILNVVNLKKMPEIIKRCVNSVIGESFWRNIETQIFLPFYISMPFPCGLILFVIKCTKTVFEDQSLWTSRTQIWQQDSWATTILDFLHTSAIWTIWTWYYNALERFPKQTIYSKLCQMRLPGCQKKRFINSTVSWKWCNISTNWWEPSDHDISKWKNIQLLKTFKSMHQEHSA